MRLAYYGSALSGNIIETPEGFLICKNVPIARTGSQEYLPDELGDMDGHGVVSVYRPEEEVFSEATLASFEGKPVTFDHPPQHITVQNVTAYNKGHVENVRRGSGPESDLMLADLFITDPDLIAAYQEFTELTKAADAITDDMDARYAAFAKAEACFLDHALVIPTHYESGWELTKINDYTRVYAMYGMQTYRYVNWEVSTEPLTTEQAAANAAAYAAE